MGWDTHNDIETGVSIVITPNEKTKRGLRKYGFFCKVLLKFLGYDTRD